MAEVRRVSPAEADRLVREEGFLYVDVRSESEFAAGHPVGAQNVPFMNAGPTGMTKNPKFVEHMKALYPHDAKLVLGCRSGGRSLRALEELAGQGYDNLVDQRAGFEGAKNAFGKLEEPGWAPAGLPVEQRTPGGSYAELKEKAGVD